MMLSNATLMLDSQLYFTMNEAQGNKKERKEAIERDRERGRRIEKKRKKKREKKNRGKVV